MDTNIETIPTKSSIKKSKQQEKRRCKEIEKENEFYMGIIYQLIMAA